jgi:hypothetical protein
MNFSRFTLKALTLAVACSSLAVEAASYGIYDPRGLAMGGTGVASSSWHQAQYYNSALLALHDENEDDSRDGRFIIPNVVVQFDDVVEDIVDAASDDLDQRLSASINDFNTDPNQATAGNVAGDARELQGLLDNLANENVNSEAFVGFSVSEPSLLEGGAFYFGVRMLALGDSTITDEDQVLLDRYIGALEVIAAGGDVSSIPADLVDANGNLIDPTTQFNSSADLGGVAISEWAVAAAKQFDFFGQSLAVGITPKIMRVDVIRETTDFASTEIDFANSQRTYVNLNVDMGVALEMFDHYRIGFAVKDLVPEEFETANGLMLQLKPRPRFGAAYVNEWVTFGVDVDVMENEPIAGEATTQDVSAGLEISPFKAFDFRLGYIQDLTGMKEDTFAGGIAYQVKSLAFELSYSRGALSTGAAFQFGVAF